MVNCLPGNGAIALLNGKTKEEEDNFKIINQ
jgi:hypothetical protein